MNLDDRNLSIVYYVMQFFPLFHLKRPLMSSVLQTQDGGCIFEVGSDFVVFVLVASRSPVPKASRLPNFRPTVKREKAHRKSRNDPRFYSHRRRRCSIRDGSTASDEAAFGLTGQICLQASILLKVRRQPCQCYFSKSFSAKSPKRGSKKNVRVFVGFESQIYQARIMRIRGSCSQNGHPDPGLVQCAREVNYVRINVSVPWD